MVPALHEIVEYSKDLTLLYVEDDEDTREITHMILEDFFDKIVVAKDGEEGLEKFIANDIDIVITDINMPGLSGIEMTREIRRIDEEIPVIIISAHNEENFFIESIQLGVNGYLLKPVDLDQLSKVLYRVLQRYKYYYQAQQNLHFLEVYKQAVNHSSIVSKTDKDGIITYVNDAFCETSGYTRDELIGKKHNIVRHPDNPKSLYEKMWHRIANEKQPWKGIIRNKTKSGKSYYVDSLIMPIVDTEGEILEYISIRHDVSDIMNPLKQLRDAIKGHSSPILLYLKLDKFDMLEEFYDGDTIEIFQSKAAEILQKTFSKLFEFEKLYILGNGEYALLIDYFQYFKRGVFLSQIHTLLEELANEEIVCRNIRFEVAVKVSIVYEKEKMLESAKLGIKHILHKHQNLIVANNLAKKEQAKAKHNLEIVSMIQNALKTGNVISYFQPIIDNATKQVVKYESLVRLIDENNQVVSPAYFLDTAKKSNYYTQITDTVLRHSFSILNIYNTSVSINLSALDIEQRSTREKILNLLQNYENRASRVVFELLEDENVKDIKTIRDFITDVKSFGVQIAIDDFGAGYSNYDRLLNYQPDILKIDGSLIKNLDRSTYALSVVKSIVTFAKEQNLETVAEFIENEKIFNIVKDLGVEYSQGYYFGKPQPLSALRESLR